MRTRMHMHMHMCTSVQVVIAAGVLKERVGVRRWGAVFVGAAAVLLVVRLGRYFLPATHFQTDCLPLDQRPSCAE